MEDDFWIIKVRPGIPQSFRLEDHQRELLLESATALGEGNEETVLSYSIGSQIPQPLCAFSPDFEIGPCLLDLKIDSSADTVSFHVTGDRTILIRGIIELHNLPNKQKHSGVLKSRNIPSNAMFRSGNITNRIFELQIRNRPCVNRRFYENILPSNTIYDVEETPADTQSFLKFTDDGKYLISFSTCVEPQSVIIYRVSLCSYPSSLPRDSNFTSYATRLCSTVLVAENPEPFETLADTFFVHVPTYGFGIFASSTDAETKIPPGSAWSHFRSLYSTRLQVAQSTTFHLIGLHDGVVIDRLVLSDDRVNLINNHGAHLFDNTTFVLTSSRNQRVMLYDIGYEGFTHTRSIDLLCFDEETLFPDHPPRIFFSRPPQAQLLDGDHLFIKFGGDTYAVANKLHAIFNMVTSKVVSFCAIEGSYQYVQSFNNFFDIRVTKTSTDIPSSSSRTSPIVDIPHLLSIRDDNKLFSRAVNHLVETFPFECQLRTPSPYLEQSRFLFDEKILCQYVQNAEMGHPERGWNLEYEEGDEAVFVSLRHPQQKFNIKPETPRLVAQSGGREFTKEDSEAKGLEERARQSARTFDVRGIFVRVKEE